jgi:hypothetical protein
MAVNQQLVERSGALKRDLLAFAREPRFSRELRAALAQRFGPVVVGDEAEVADFLDHFMLLHRLTDGRTVVEHFVDAHPELPEAEREMLLGWRNAVEGIFEVLRRRDDVLVALNLVDEMEYLVHSNMGPRVYRQTPDGSFLIARLVPIGEEWLLSGYLRTLPASARAEAHRLALDLSVQNPSLVFRNPDKLEQGWRLQREERHAFVEFFGSDLVVLSGQEVTGRIDAFHHHRRETLLAADGHGAVESSKRRTDALPPALKLTLPPDLVAAQTVGVIYDEVDGLNFLADFGLVQEAFSDPARLVDPQYHAVVLTYLKDPTVSPRLLQRLAEQDTVRATQVVRRVLKRPRFSWEQDGEALLHRYKRSYYTHPVLPGVSAVSERLSGAQAARAKAGDAPTAEQRPGRNDPCPCGSGKKYKQCHGR